MYFVYVLYSQSHNRTYTGLTKDVNNRLKRHNLKYNKSTKAYAPWELVYVEECTTREDARKTEKYLKTGAGREIIKTLLNSRSEWPRSSIRLRRTGTPPAHRYASGAQAE